MAMLKYTIEIILDSTNGEVTLAEIAKRLSGAVQDSGLDVNVIPAGDQSSDVWFVKRRKRDPKLL